MEREPAIETATTPQQRLELTRQALAQQLARRNRRRRREDDGLAADVAQPQDGWATKARRAARVWWQRHPVHDAVDFARPALEDYARQRPLQLVGIAAGTGVALTLLKSWRLLPLTGIAMALLKTSDFKSVGKTLVSRVPSPHEPSP